MAPEPRLIASRTKIGEQNGEQTQPNEAASRKSRDFRLSQALVYPVVKKGSSAAAAVDDLINPEIPVRDGQARIPCGTRRIATAVVVALIPRSAIRWAGMSNTEWQLAYALIGDSHQALAGRIVPT
jgi:hypothetical protein